MCRLRGVEWRPWLLALGGTLLVVILASGSRVQATDHALQTVPTPTPRTVPTPDENETPVPTPDEDETPGPPASQSPSEITLKLRQEAEPTGVLPGEAILFTLSLTNTSTAAVMDVVVVDALDPSLRPLEVLATQGGVQFQGRSALIHLGTLEAGQTALIILRTEVSTDARAGQIILNQFMAHADGEEVRSNIAAVGLPPEELPATGFEEREP